MSVLISVFMFLLITPPAITSSAEARSKSESIVSAAAQSISDALVKPPRDNEICFSPDEPCDVKLVKFIQSARQSIDVAIYDLNLEQLVHELLVASKKIRVRILVDRKQAKGKHSLVPLLIKAGAQIRYGHQRGIMHNKFAIVDGNRVETGSFNYTHHARSSNNENQIYLGAPEIVARYQQRFNVIWDKADEAQ
ncbi:MAG: phospholipase D-like domain-containing protein [Oligoflexia bacterium]|nr:phospholipase D-like domain-containing protein [Oligoflexia bacterium]